MIAAYVSNISFLNIKVWRTALVAMAAMVGATYLVRKESPQLLFDTIEAWAATMQSIIPSL